MTSALRIQLILGAGVFAAVVAALTFLLGRHVVGVLLLLVVVFAALFVRSSVRRDRVERPQLEEVTTMRLTEEATRWLEEPIPEWFRRDEVEGLIKDFCDALDRIEALEVENWNLKEEMRSS